MSSRLLMLWKVTDMTWQGGNNYTVRKPCKHKKPVICVVLFVVTNFISIAFC